MFFPLTPTVSNPPQNFDGKVFRKNYSNPFRLIGIVSDDPSSLSTLILSTFRRKECVNTGLILLSSGHDSLKEHKKGK